MNSEGLKRRLEALREQRARIDPAIEQLEAQLDAQERAEQRGGRGPGGRACPRRGLLRAAEGEVRQALLPLRQARRGAARAVLVLLLEERWEDQEQICGEEPDCRSVNRVVLCARNR